MEMAGVLCLRRLKLHNFFVSKDSTALHLIVLDLLLLMNTCFFAMATVMQMHSYSICLFIT